MRVARLVYASTYPGRTIRRSALQVIHRAVANDWGGALERAYTHLTLVKGEHTQAETAALLLERWATGTAADTTEQTLQIGQVAKLLGVTLDMLRNWERNGLVRVPRAKNNWYRAYGSVEISRVHVIRMLSKAGYGQQAILRMMLQLDQGKTAHLRKTLNTPDPNENVYLATDRWLSTLAEQEQAALTLIKLVEDIIQSRTHAKRQQRLPKGLI